MSLSGCSAMSPRIIEFPDFRIILDSPHRIAYNCRATKWDSGKPRKPGSPVTGCYIPRPGKPGGDLPGKATILLPWNNPPASSLAHELGHHYGINLSTSIWWGE